MGTDANAPWSDHAEGRLEFVCVLSEHGSDELRFGVRRKAHQTQQHHTTRRLPQTKYECSKILICRHQQCFSLVCLLKNLIVRDTRIHLCHIAHLVTVLAQSFDDLTFNTFIGKEVHKC